MSNNQHIDYQTWEKNTFAVKNFSLPSLTTLIRPSFPQGGEYEAWHRANFQQNSFQLGGELSRDENQYVVEFKNLLAPILRNPNRSDDDIISAARGVFSSASKKSSSCNNMFVEILTVMKEHISNDAMKYKNLNSFLGEYPQFGGEKEDELHRLMETANWMVILFKLVTARKNKGLSIFVVPKVVEGRQASYITGSGQTAATSNRVHIYQKEGHVNPVKRPTVKAKKELLPNSVPVNVNHNFRAKNSSQATQEHLATILGQCDEPAFDRGFSLGMEEPTFKRGCSLTDQFVPKRLNVMPDEPLSVRQTTMGRWGADLPCDLNSSIEPDLFVDIDY